MEEVDPVILAVKAEVDRYQADLKRATRTVDQQLGTQEKRIKKLETEFRSSSSAIALSIKGLAGTLATAFTGRELVGLLDSFTRLQNQLRVSGLEGESLGQVQEKLLALSGRYGVSIEELANLYGKSSQAAAELGATEAQLLQITQNSAAALKITGTSATQAQGALLGLTQALSSGTVRAEEFNQINEGGLRPLLQAAANTERFGGSVAKLRQAVVEGKLSSQEFYQSILAGSADLEAKAAKATLTLQGATTALTSALTVYVGEAAQANGVTGALAEGIQALAENVDTVVEALATVAAFIGARYVLALGLAITQTAALGGVVAALGGVPAIAVGALAASVVILASRFGEADRAAENVRAAIERQAEELGTLRSKTLEAAAANDTLDAKQKNILTGVANLTGEVDKLSEAWGRVAAAAKQAAIEQAQATLDAARSKQIEARLTSNVRREAFNRTANRPFAERGLGRDALPTNPRDAIAASDRAAAADPEQARLERIAAANVREAQRQLDEVKKRGLATFAPPSSAPPAPPTGNGAGGSSGAGASGLDPFQAELRFRNELDSVRARLAAAESVRATTAEERAEFERRQLELAQAQVLRDIDADPELDAIDKEDGRTRREILRERLLALGEAERDNITFRERADLERQQLDLLQEQGRVRIDALRLQFDLADTESERRSLALQILDAENDLLKSRLSILAKSETIDKADAERAQIALDALKAQEGAQRAVVNRQFATPLERFGINAQDSDTRIQEAVVRRVQDINRTITDSFTNALGIKDPFLSELISIFLDKNVFGPLAEALSNSDLQGNGGGIIAGIGSVLGSLFGRSSGGFVQAGRPYRVNEGAPAGRVEAFVPNTSGQIIPLGRMNAVAQGGAAPSAGGVVRVVIEEAPGFAARVRTEATGVALEVTRATAPQIIDAAANETLNRASRPRL